MKRNRLPLNGLRVLDVLARHRSLSDAANELAVTPSAVRKHVRSLEGQLGTILVRCKPQGLELTDEAIAGLTTLRDGFAKLEESVRAIRD